MDQGTQQNAAMVEESTAASHSLAREADSLFSLVGAFETGSQRSAQTAVSARPVVPSAAPQRSPVRSLVNRVASSFNGNAALKANSWEEF